MEKWNAYTKDGKLTDTVLVRGEPIPQGLYYLACEVLVRHEDGSFLCMKRATTKPAYPGYYEATAGGAALLGETNIQCIKRELEEETGIVCDNFVEVGVSLSHQNQNIIYSYTCVTNCDKNSIKLQAGETEDYMWMTEEEFIDFINSDKMIDSQKQRYFDYFINMKYINTQPSTIR